MVARAKNFYFPSSFDSTCFQLHRTTIAPCRAIWSLTILGNFGKFWEISESCCFCCNKVLFLLLKNATPVAFWAKQKSLAIVWPHTIHQLKYWAPKSSGNTGAVAMKLHEHPHCIVGFGIQPFTFQIPCLCLLCEKYWNFTKIYTKILNRSTGR